jgi:thiosulfate/3-mercaptopyruvate sulfurtransferase
MLDPLVTTAWLAKHRDEADLRIVDGTWHMPQLARDARAEFVTAHIPGAVFFDIDAVADHATSLPHMLPGAEAFAATVGALGIGSGDRVVVYDVRGRRARRRSAQVAGRGTSRRVGRAQAGAASVHRAAAR